MGGEAPVGGGEAGPGGQRHVAPAGLEAGRLRPHLALGHHGDVGPAVHEPGVEGPDVLHHGLGAGGGRLVGGVGDLVGDRPVDLVADPREHRHGRARPSPGRPPRCRRRPGRSCPAAPDEQHDVDALAGATARSAQAIERGAVGALHPGVGPHDPEARGRTAAARRRTSASAALPTLVTSPIRSGTTGRTRPACRPEQALGLEPAQQPLAVRGQAPERERRVDGGHPQLDLPAGRVPLEPAPDPHLGAVGHADRAARGLQRALTRAPARWRTAPPAAWPAAGGSGRPRARARPGRTTPWPVAAAVEVADLALHPHLVREGRAQREPDRPARSR